MSEDHTPTLSWGQRALAHARTITNASPGRGSATTAEAAAADYVRHQLAALGITDVRTQSFRGLRSIWLFLSLVFGLALVGHAAYWLLHTPLGSLPAWLVSTLAFGLSGLLLWRKFTFRSYPLRESLPHGPSQNVIAIIPPQGDLRERVVLVSHLDSHRAVFWFATDFLIKFFALSEPVAMYGVFLAPVLYILVVVTHWQVFAWVALYLALNHFLGWFTGITADLGPYSPGANDNASAAGTLLTFAQRIKQQPLQHTEVWLAFTGCEESGCDGMITLLQAHGKELKDALFLDFELVGIGEQLVYIHDEGILRKRSIPAEVERLVIEAGQPFSLKPIRARSVGAFTENGTALEHGFKSVCLMAQRKDSPLLPEWHRMTDIPNRLQHETLGSVHALTWEILHRVDTVGFLRSAYPASVEQDSLQRIDQ